MHASAGLRRLSAGSAFGATSIWLWFLLFGSRLAWTTTDEFLRLHESPLHVLQSLLSLVSFVGALIAMAGLRDRVPATESGTARLALIAFAIGTAVDGLFRAVQAITVETIWAGQALAAADADERARVLAKVDAFREVGEGVFPVFGVFFVLAFLLFAASSRKLDRPLAALLVAGGLAMATLYLAAHLAMPPPSWSWTVYELLMIALYLRLGVVLLRPARESPS